MKYHTKIQRGYAALTTAFTLSLLLLVLSIGASASALFARENVSSVENRAIAKHAASSCAETALLYLASEIRYEPNPAGDLVQVSKGVFCTIASVVWDSNKATLTTKSSVRGSLVKIEVEAIVDIERDKPVIITLWQEIK